MKRIAFALLLLSAIGGCDTSSTSSGLVETKGESKGKLPELHKVPEFSFTNQDGEPFGSKELQGEPYVAAFMFTRCPTICPKLTKQMQAIDMAMKGTGRRLQLVSITVDPENDTPEVLAAYAKKHGISSKTWAFVTGDHKTIGKTAQEGFKVALAGKADESKADFGIMHGSHLVLVDSKGMIRGYFGSNGDNVIGELMVALRRL